MLKKAPAHSALVSIPFHSIRNISSPEDLQQGRKVLAGHVPIASILDLPTNENVRDYLVDAPGKKRRRPTAVHRAIKDTLRNHPEDFCVLNGGVTVVARDHEVDERKKMINLLEPSIINGSQTQGVLLDFFNEYEKAGIDIPDVHVKLEAIITTEDDLIAEVSIARNFQNDVMSISIAGRLGQLDELEKAMQKRLPDFKLKKSETELSDEYLETEHLLQVITLLIPEELWLKEGEQVNPSKVYAYSRKSQCLKEFGELYDTVKNNKRAKWLQKAEPEQLENLYGFYLGIAADAYQLHQKWKKHQGFYGTGLRSIERNDRGQILDVPDGIIFPIIASLSVFAEQTSDGWRLNIPESLSDQELIQVAKETYIEVAKSNPSNMGRLKACYTPLYRITNVYKKLAKQPA